MQNAIEASKSHCAFCFQVLLSYFKKEEMPKLPDALPKVNVPVFVTLHVFDDQLRGCIGTFSPGPVEKVLTKFTLSSAF